MTSNPLWRSPIAWSAWSLPLLGLVCMAGCDDQRSAHQEAPATATTEASTNTSRPVLAPQGDTAAEHGSSAGTVSNAPADASPPSADHSLNQAAQQSATRTLHSDAAQGADTPPDPIQQNEQPQTAQPTSGH